MDPSPSATPDAPVFLRMLPILEAGFRTDGYAVSTGDPQEWGKRFSISRPEIDGSVTLFFGPLSLATDEAPPHLPYLITWEASWRGTIALPRSEDPERLANEFLRQIFRFLAMLLRSRRAAGRDVGVGLVPPNAMETPATHDQRAGAATLDPNR